MRNGFSGLYITATGRLSEEQKVMASLPSNSDSDDLTQGEESYIFPSFVGDFNVWPYLSTMGYQTRIERPENKAQKACLFRGLQKLKNFKGSRTDRPSRVWGSVGVGEGISV